ncbi:MAG TPA: GFA family protein, partial [Pseudomonas sp.]|nr:GFA family protein [Pseudomonas sp.]
MQTHTGSCLCGVVRYRIDAPIDALTHCHCKMCRKAHGAAFATYASV